MGFLSISDRKEASLVCRKWFDASLDPSLQGNVTVKYLSAMENSVSLLCCRRKFRLVLTNIDNAIKFTLANFSKVIGENLTSLSFEGSNITEKTLISLLSKCNNLMSLDLSYCNSLFMSGNLLSDGFDIKQVKHSLQNVKEVNLSGIRFLSDVSFNRIMAVCSNVEKLLLVASPIVFNSSIYYPRADNQNASASVLSFQNILRFVENSGKQLKSLNLNRTLLSNAALCKLVEVADLQLQELHIVGCFQITDDGVGKLCEHQISLHVLDISSCAGITNYGLLKICGTMMQLQCLRMNKCREITDTSLKQLCSLPHLETLELSECYPVTSDGLIAGICKNPKCKLTHLDLNGCSLLKDDFIIELTLSGKYLTHLNLGSCFSLTDVSIHMISKHLKYLQYFCVAWCKITNLGLVGYETNLLKHNSGYLLENDGCRCTRLKSRTTLEQLLVETREKHTVEEHLKTWVKEGKKGYGLKNLANLRYLDLSACSMLTDFGIKEAIRFTELHTLILNSVHELNDAGVVAIAENNPSLQDVQLSQCKRLTDCSVEVISKKLHRLALLDVSCCLLLTDKSLHSLMAHAKRLKQLDVSFCCNMTLKVIDKTEMAIQSLTSVSKRHFMLV